MDTRGDTKPRVDGILHECGVFIEEKESGPKKKDVARK
jgi:hypothetical protein